MEAVEIVLGKETLRTPTVTRKSDAAANIPKKGDRKV